jgi:cytochrome c oxidase cbb3-type subunit 4
MIKNVLENIGGVGIYGIISVSLFFAFFIGMLIWACRLKKNYLNTMGELPLDGGETTPESRNESNQKSELP